MFMDLRAARNGDILALSGTIETLGGQTAVLQLSHVEDNKAHLTLLLGPAQSDTPQRQQLTQLFNVPKTVRGVVIHLTAPFGNLSFGLPLSS